MTYTFDGDVAEACGVIAATMLCSLEMLIEQNKAHNENYINDRYWARLSVEGWQRMHPFATKRQIRDGLSSLKDLGYVLTGYFNKSNFDHTTWYTIDDTRYEDA